MCNVFSGLIVTQKGKDWGKVLFTTGVHHEKDREIHKKKYGDNMLAWESKKPYSLKDGFIFTHTLNVNIKEQIELLKLVEIWAKNQEPENLLRQMITVIKDNKPTEDYVIFENMIKTEDNTNIISDFTTYITQGNGSTATQGDGSTARQGNESTVTQGDGSTATQGDRSTHIVYGCIGYIILSGKNNTFIQHYCENDKYIKKIIDVDKLFKKYEEGDKIRIFKGKTSLVEKR